MIGSHLWVPLDRRTDLEANYLTVTISARERASQGRGCAVLALAFGTLCSFQGAGPGGSRVPPLRGRLPPHLLRVRHPRCPLNGTIGAQTTRPGGCRAEGGRYRAILRLSNFAVEGPSGPVPRDRLLLARAILIVSPCAHQRRGRQGTGRVSSAQTCWSAPRARRSSTARREPALRRSSPAPRSLGTVRMRQREERRCEAQRTSCTPPSR